MEGGSYEVTQGALIWEAKFPTPPDLLTHSFAFPLAFQFFMYEVKKIYPRGRSWHQAGRISKAKTTLQGSNASYIFSIGNVC